jgi:hypothetical protein
MRYIYSWCMRFNDLHKNQKVQWTFRDGDRSGVATGIVLSKNSETSRALIDVIHGADRSGVNVEIPAHHLNVSVDAAIVESSIRDRFKMGTPTDKQLTLINQFIPVGASSMTAAEVITIPFVAADNLVNRSLDCWDVPSLKKMTQLLPGLPMTLDHDWDDTSKEWGRIYNAEFIRSQTAPEGAIDRAGNANRNRQIIAKHGFNQVVFEVFAPVDSPVVKALKRGHSGGVSTGGFQFTDYFCPSCDKSFYDENCPHVPPDRWMGITEDDPDVAPYAIRVGLFDIGEVSIVTMPNLPNAGILK